MSRPDRPVCRLPLQRKRTQPDTRCLVLTMIQQHSISRRLRCRLACRWRPQRRTTPLGILLLRPSSKSWRGSTTPVPRCSLSNAIRQRWRHRMSGTCQPRSLARSQGRRWRQGLLSICLHRSWHTQWLPWSLQTCLRCRQHTWKHQHQSTSPPSKMNTPRILRFP